MLRKILGVWCEFLSTNDSRYVLNDSPSGWKGEAARRAIGIEQYQYDPRDQYSGFTSWDYFFTRRLADSERPVAGTIVRALAQEGTYHSEADSEWADAAEPQYSQ